MSPGTVPPDAVLYAGQATVQTVLLALAFVTVPWMLFAKPLLLRAIVVPVLLGGLRPVS